MIERLFELAGLPSNDILLEAAYDNMVTTIKQKFPDKSSMIDDNIKQAKKVLTAPNKKAPTSDKMIWYIKVLRAFLLNDLNIVKGNYNFKDMESFNNDFFHYYGFNIPQIFNTELANQNISELFTSFQNIVQQYQKSDKAPVPVRKGDYELIKCNDGTSWWFVDRAYCEEEGRSGKHCGNVVGQHDKRQRILSLRSVNHNVILTFILEKNGYLGEMKAKANLKPAEKYHANIMQLLLNPIVKGIKGAGYAPYMNFSIFDLSENDIKVLMNHGKQKLILDQIYAEPMEFFKAPEYIKADKNWQQMAIYAKPALEYLIGKEKDLQAWEYVIHLVDSSLIIYAPNNLINFNELVIQHLKLHPKDLMRAPKSVSTHFDILKALVEIPGRGDSYIHYIMPNTPRYDELCKIAIKSNMNALDNIPLEYRTMELYKIAIMNGYELYRIPLDNFNDDEQLELCKIAVSKNGKAIHYVPDHLEDKIKQELNIQESVDFKYFQNL